MIIPVSIIILVKDVTPESCKFWMQKRSESGPLDGMLEFPGGKIEPGETPAACAIREFAEEAGVRLAHAEQFKMVSHEYPDRSVCLYVHFALGERAQPKNGEWYDFNFSSGSAGYKGRLPEVNYEIIDDLISYIKKHIDAGLLEKIWVRKS
ncbi:hypothetical protein A9Q84_19560 [Halobacteriovorax marinus]|uniref:8-oxo-dGTP diphosphatase n=1 Tax=Halobacteriovorax marinus TaxID=97084 RepID=A0A1Y5F2K5_9BACT|nr:hypothetical protein A9Q84_19560 [Halobacteriovorax marinus]